MPFRLATPLVTDQGAFPFAALTLVVSPAFTVDGVEAQIVLIAQPYDLVNGAVKRPMETVEAENESGDKYLVDVPSTAYDRKVVFGTGYADARTDPALAAALSKISPALQEYLAIAMAEEA